MSIQFRSLSRPRRAAKALQEHIPGLKLSAAQESIASMCGYPDWAALKQASEASNAQASPDDEDLSVEQLQSRKAAQAQAIRKVFGNSLAQAQEIVRLCSPTTRTPAAESALPPGKRPLLRGRNVFSINEDLRFGPNYAAVYFCLTGVKKVHVGFLQPSEFESARSHLPSEMTFTFVNDTTLTVDGAFFWKFCDTTPLELQDEDGADLATTPYTGESATTLMERLRTAFKFMFVAAPDRFSFDKPPLWVEMDLDTTVVTTRHPPRLSQETWRALQPYIADALAQQANKFEKLVDDFVLTSLSSPYTEMHVELRGPKSRAVVGNRYDSMPWSGTGHWTFKDLLRCTSSQGWGPEGCGGNLTYSETLSRLLDEPVQHLANQVCCLALADKALVAAMREALELEPSRRRKRQLLAEELAQGLLATSTRVDLLHEVQYALTRQHDDRTLDSWRPTLGRDLARTRPTVKFEELLARIRNDHPQKQA